MTPRSLLVSAMIWGGLLCGAGLGQAQEFSPPDCQAFTGDAHVKCLHAVIEMQEHKIAQIEEAIHGQNGARDQTQRQQDRQAAVTEKIQQELAEMPATSPATALAYMPPPVAPGYAYTGYGYPGVPYYGYGYPAYGAGLSLYPGLGLSFNFGVPGYYGRPFYGPRYFYRPRAFYGPGFYGPRLYGPRYFPSPRYYGSRSFGRHR